MSNQADTYWRQMDILPPHLMQDVRIHLIGCGGIGSPVGVMLAKMGFSSFVLFDDDTIELHNLPNQLYPMLTTKGSVGDVWQLNSVIGQKKAEILAETMHNFSNGQNLRTVFIEEKYSNQRLNGLVISGVDNMAARRVIWNSVKLQKETVPLYIDARMGAQIGVVYTIDPSNEAQVEFFEKVALYSDADAIELPCTNRAILYNTFMLAALVGRQVRNYLKGLDTPLEIICDIENLALAKGGLDETDE